MVDFEWDEDNLFELVNDLIHKHTIWTLDTHNQVFERIWHNLFE